MKAMTMTTHSKNKPPHAVTPEEVAEMKRLRSEGKHYKEVGRLLNRHPLTVIQHTPEFRIKKDLEKESFSQNGMFEFNGNNWINLFI